MFFSHLLPRVLPGLLDPPCSILWRSQAARRILVHRVIAVRRILVISPESSLHARRAVLVFARAKMCGHLPLFVPPNVHQESHRLLSHSSSIYREIGWANVRQATFLFSGTILSMGRCWFSSRWPLALWGPGLPSIQRSLDGLISSKCKFFVSVLWYFLGKQ